MVAMSGMFATDVRADEPSTYTKLCASCHGQDGRADTPVGRALKIPSFEGASFTRDQVEKLLRESQSHTGLAGRLGEGDLDGLVETLNALAARP
jgi:cytochrome c553